MPEVLRAPIVISTLEKRSEFLRLRGGARWGTPGFALEMKPAAGPATAGHARFGFTVTKQIGNAVIRNRVRRRLKAAVRAIAPTHARAGFDYVLFARLPALDRPFAELERDLEQAFAKIHRPPKAKNQA